MSNPLLNFDGLPRFDEIRPEHVTPAIETLLNLSLIHISEPTRH